DVPPGPERPPGLYGPAAAPRAFNLGAFVADAPALPAWPPGTMVRPFGVAQEWDARPWLLVLAVILACAELAASLAVRGRAVALVRAGAAALMIGCAGAGPAGALDDAYVVDATAEFRLGYVVTGDRDIDEITRAGLWGLGTILRSRTSVEPGDPMAIDLERDELIFFPLVYWPVTADQPRPSDAAHAKIDRYLRTGGILVLDIRDPDSALAGGSGGSSAALRRLLAGLSVPPLVPMPVDHVLTRSFYLLDEFPGRWTGGQVWVEQSDAGVNDGVSSLVVGSHDWVAAWAMDRRLQPLLPVVPGGERQREIAYRFGINLVMYATTGNYKADAVHVPTILERLGQ
ncbi:MAG: DUF4159 domain-containing protein, partial [Alphaproteobacteria bacterium]